MEQENVGAGDSALKLNKNAWDISLITKPQEKKASNGLEADKPSTGLSRLANFKKLAAASSLKDGEKPTSFSFSSFARGKLMGPPPSPALPPSGDRDNTESQERTDQDQENKAPNVAKDQPAPSSSSSLSSMSWSTSRRRPYEYTLYDDLSSTSSAKSDHSSNQNNIKESPPKKMVRLEEPIEMDGVDTQKAVATEDKPQVKGESQYDIPDDDDDEGDDDHGKEKKPTKFNGNSGNNGIKKSFNKGKRSTVDKPNYQRVNMRKKCFTRFGAASSNRKKRLLKFRKRSNRATARREMAEASEWGLDEAPDTAVSDAIAESARSNGQPSGTMPTSRAPDARASLSLTTNLPKEFIDKVMAFDNDNLSEPQIQAVEQLLLGNSTFHQMSPPADYSGPEGWFHQTSSWAQVVVSVVENHRNYRRTAGEEEARSFNNLGSVVGLVIVCDPNCPLPLPSVAKKTAKKNAKNLYLGGAAITGEMSSDERQEVVSRARCAEISYVICRPEMLLSSDWFNRSGMPEICCICLLFSERLVPSPWLANNCIPMVKSGKGNFNNTRPEHAGLFIRIQSLFDVNANDVKSDDQSLSLPLLIASPFDKSVLARPLHLSSNVFSMAVTSKKAVQVATYSVASKLAACSKLLQSLISTANDYSVVVFVCESLTSAMRLEQLFRQDGNIAVYFSMGGPKKSQSTKGSSGPKSIDLIRIASPDDIVQAALLGEPAKSCQGASLLKIIVTSVDVLHHALLFSGAHEQNSSSLVTVFVGLPPSPGYFQITHDFSKSHNCVLVDSSPNVELNTALKSLYALSGNLYVFKQIVENLLSASKICENSENSENANYYWKSVDVAFLANKIDCHPSLILAVITQLHRHGIVVEVAGSRQDTCSVRLYGSDPDSVALFEDNPLLVAARRVEDAESEDANWRTSIKKNQRSLTFSLCDLANQMDQNPDQIRRHLYQLRPINNRGSKAYSQRSPLVITFAPKWCFVYKYCGSKVEMDKIIKLVTEELVAGERLVYASKCSMSSKIYDISKPMVTKLESVGPFSSISFESFDDLAAIADNLPVDKFVPSTANDIESAKSAINDVIDTWSMANDGIGGRLTPWAIARHLHGIVLPGIPNGVSRGGADWVPTSRIASNDYQCNQSLRVPYMRLVELARQELMS